MKVIEVKRSIFENNDKLMNLLKIIDLQIVDYLQTWN